MPPVEYRRLLPDEEVAVSELLLTTFHRFVAPGYAPEGITEFERLARPEAIAERARSGHLVLVAVEGPDPVGVIEVRDNRHLSLLFVAARAHRRGIARELVQRARAVARAARPGLSRITVNSSRYAVGFYRKLGFIAVGAQKTENGMVLVPMALDLEP